MPSAKHGRLQGNYFSLSIAHTSAPNLAEICVPICTNLRCVKSLGDSEVARRSQRWHLHADYGRRGIRCGLKSKPDVFRHEKRRQGTTMSEAHTEVVQAVIMALKTSRMQADIPIVPSLGLIFIMDMAPCHYEQKCGGFAI
jgi:hypothetical protein